MSERFPQVDTLLFFGSFDPITLGHEAVIRIGIELLQPKSVDLVPAFREGWGKKLTSYADRTAMINLVISQNDDWQDVVRVNDIEKTAGLSGVTAETLHLLLDHQQVSSRLGLLMGADWILSFPTWEEWEWMLSVAPAFVGIRGDETEASLRAKISTQAQAYLDHKIFFLPAIATDATRKVSSTLVRQSMKEKGITELVQPKVLSYMSASNLYI